MGPSLSDANSGVADGSAHVDAVVEEPFDALVRAVAVSPDSGDEAEGQRG